MRTRCPACSTTFRVTSEQLRLKAGKVRCGQCLAVFNAFESLIEEEAPVPAEAAPPAAAQPAAPTVKIVPPAPEATPPVVVIEKPVEVEPEPAPLPTPAPNTAPAEEIKTEVATAIEEDTTDATQAARDAGLMAARELSETSAYNRWAAGTLAGETQNRFDPVQPEQPRWPFVLTSLVLLMLLLTQLLYHFRTEVVQRVPDMSGLYAMAATNVPLPQNSELVGIDVSDLQADNARGLLILQATVRNRATFAQAWPLLELTLTDTQDAVISRRVLSAEEYLPPGSHTPAFAGRSDIAIKLWLEAKGVGASGYRLYLFYP